MRKRELIFFVLFLLLPVIVFSQSTRKKVNEGNQLFEEEKYDEANNKYQDALLDNPASTEIQFNVGDVNYKKKKFEDALEAFYKSLDSKQIELQAKAYYNIGNTFYKSGKLAESIQAYKQALKLNPQDEDAKYNLEFVRNKLKQNASNQNQQNNQQQEQKQQQQKDQNNKDKEKEQQQKKDERQQQEQKEQQSQEEKKKISKEEAERILQALKENQEKMKKKQIKTQGKVKVVKDW